MLRLEDLEDLRAQTFRHLRGEMHLVPLLEGGVGSCRLIADRCHQSRADRLRTRWIERFPVRIDELRPSDTAEELVLVDLPAARGVHVRHVPVLAQQPSNGVRAVEEMLVRQKLESVER